jgi:2'-5' RNA ligase
MRLFVAIDIDEAIRERIVRFMDGLIKFAPNARWAKPESLHVTLKFIGEQPVEAVENIKRELGQIEGQPSKIVFQGWGFFPTPKAPRVFWVGMEADAYLAKLASSVDRALSRLKVPTEERAYQPHLTLARAGGRSGAPRRLAGDRTNRDFEKLQQRLSVLPMTEFGSMTGREFYLYQSQLSPGGSRYTKLERFPLAQSSA